MYATLWYRVCIGVVVSRGNFSKLWVCLLLHYFMMCREFGFIPLQTLVGLFVLHSIVGNWAVVFDGLVAMVISPSMAIMVLDGTSGVFLHPLVFGCLSVRHYCKCFLWPKPLKVLFSFGGVSSTLDEVCVLTQTTVAMFSVMLCGVDFGGSVPTVIKVPAGWTRLALSTSVWPLTSLKCWSTRLVYWPSLFECIFSRRCLVSSVKPWISVTCLVTLSVTSALTRKYYFPNFRVQWWLHKIATLPNCGSL